MRAYDTLIEHIKQATILQNINQLLEWDEQVYLTKKGHEIRIQQHATLAQIAHKLHTKPEIGTLIEQAQQETLTEEETANLREIRRDYTQKIRIPEELVVQISNANSNGYNAWIQAKQDNNYEHFKPHLKKIIELQQQYAHAINPNQEPYQTLFELYEPGTTTQEIDMFFTEIREEIIPLIQQLHTKKTDTTQLEMQWSGVDETLKQIIQAIGFDFSNGSIHETIHPFMCKPADIRIQIRYDNGWFDTLLTGAHEAGHGIYEQGINQTHYGTPLSEPSSFAIHESQSRFYENHIVRNTEFLKHFKLPVPCDETFDKNIHTIQPTLIRTASDELTYPLHIIIRYEIEAALIRGEITVDELPNIWNKKYKEYFGLDVPDDTHGVLQDVHWASGLFGYFPTYAIGSMIAAQINDYLTEHLNLAQLIEQNTLQPVQKWLNEHIHKHGRRYEPKELVHQALGEDINTQAYLKHLRDLYQKYA